MDSTGMSYIYIVTDDELTTVSQLNALFRVIALLSRVPVLARDQTTKEKKDRGHVESEQTKNRKAQVTYYSRSSTKLTCSLIDLFL